MITNQRFASLLLSAALLASSGCSGIFGGVWPKREDPSKSQPASSGMHVKVAGDGFALGDVEQPALTSQKFVEHVNEMLAARHRPAAARWIQRYPDLALNVLREPYSVQTTADVLTVVAQAHDQQCSRCGPESGWTPVFAGRAGHPQQYSDYEDQRRQFMTELQNGNTSQALARQLPASARGPHDVLALDAWRLQGIALVLAERPGDAVEALRQALQQAGQAHPYEAINVQLLLSDAKRRAGDLAAAQELWQTAAQAACELAQAPLPVLDPILWERIAYLRPVSCAWPPALVARMTDYIVRFGIATPPREPIQLTSTAPPANDESPVWVSIGHWRLAREEPQAALVALKRAETMNPDHYAAARLQLAEARALVRMGQQPAAMAMLIQAAGSSDVRLSLPATALLGTMKLKQGAVQQGFNLLHRAVEENPGCFWPEQPDAAADLGLAYLLMGDEASGLRWLHEAQQGFEAAGQHDSLVQCLENEAAWMDHAKKKDQAAAVHKRLETLNTL